MEQVLKTAEKAFKQVFKNKGYAPEDLLEQPEYKDLVEATAALFNTQIPHHTPDAMRIYLEQDVFLFSGLRTHAQLAEARSLLKDENGNIRPYYDFEQKILKLNKTYNRNYLEAEYTFASHSAMSAAQWANLQDDTERYWLEYRTAGDERVRAEHDALRGICLPQKDPFWNNYYPPNGWRCRCVAIEVLAKEKTLSDSPKAIEQGKLATTQIGKTGKNKLAMFRFNPGQQKKIFPPNNSYNPKYCSNGKTTLNLNSSNIFLSLEDERCKAKQIIEEKAREIDRQVRQQKDNELKKWFAENLMEGVKTNYISIVSNNFKNEVRISKSNIESILQHTKELSNKEIIKDIIKVFSEANFTHEAPLENKNSKNYGKKIGRGVLFYNYYTTEWKGKTIEINMEVMKKGYEQPYAILFDKKRKHPKSE